MRSHAAPGPDDIVVLGGYGAVGTLVSTRLGALFPGKVFAAGRDSRRADELAERTSHTVRPMVMDLANEEEAGTLLSGARIVVGCTERATAATVVAALRGGTHWVDISASHERLTELERLDSVAREHEATIVLSVGLCPGLTNLLALQCATALDRTTAGIDIAVLLGLGEEHGAEAISWTVDRIARPFEAPGAGLVRPFSDPAPAAFIGLRGSRRCYRFDFADQHVLARTLGAPAATRLCFDSRSVTAALALAALVGLTSHLRSARLRSLVITTMSRVHLGSDRYALNVRATSRDGQSVEARAAGRSEAQATAVVAAAVIAQLMSGGTHTLGCVHVDQLPDALDLLEVIAAGGVHLTSPRSSSPRQVKTRS